MSWNTSVLTDAGVDLLNESLAGHTLTIESAVGGTGTQTEEAIKAATEVAELKQTLNLIGIEDVEDGKRIGIQITNEDVSESYVLKQIGVKARLDDAPLTLLFVLQDEHGVEIPTETDNPDFLFEVYAVIAISDDANIVVNVNASTMASIAYVDAKVKSAIEETIVKRDITIPTTGWDVGAEDSEDYYVDIAQSDVTEEMVPAISIHPTSMAAAKACGLSTAARTLAGAVRLYANKAPTSEIQATLMLLYASNGEAGNVVITMTDYVLPTATATRLGGVMIGENVSVETDGTISVDKEDLLDDVVATSDEVKEMLDEVFS